MICFIISDCRSLIALSLILAMLLFKPAPLYILDEVDAALDISHTQNIGQMIKSHFKHSQVLWILLFSKTFIIIKNIDEFLLWPYDGKGCFLCFKFLGVVQK